MSEPRAKLGETLRILAEGCRGGGSPFYGALVDAMVADADAGGPVWSLLAPHAAATFDDAYPLRLLGGVHKLVLAGRAPELARHYPSTGGDADAAAAWPAFRALLASAPPVVLDALSRPPQTNEVGRSIPLLGGLLVIANETGLPLRLRELGSSAGLNLRFDRYWFEQDGVGWGDPESKVCFTDFWGGSRGLFEHGLTIADRRGCDRDPIDAGTDEARLTLLSYVWPDQVQRFQVLGAALDAARDAPVTIDRADAGDWVAWQLGESARGMVTVVYHSVFWQYLSQATRASILTVLRTAGRRATRDAPLAWLRLEPHPKDYFPAELRLTVWPPPDRVPENRLLATSGFHLGPVDWMAEQPP